MVRWIPSAIIKCRLGHSHLPRTDHSMVPTTIPKGTILYRRRTGDYVPDVP
jgi:hypothetical protein